MLINSCVHSVSVCRDSVMCQGLPHLELTFTCSLLVHCNGLPLCLPASRLTPSSPSSTLMPRSSSDTIFWRLHTCAFTGLITPYHDSSKLRVHEPFPANRCVSLGSYYDVLSAVFCFHLNLPPNLKIRKFYIKF